MNKIIITGNLTKDPELRTSSSDLKVCHFSVAVKRPYSKDAVDFIDCTAFRQTAEFVNRYFMKGKPIMVEGRLQSRKWEKDGVKRTAWEIIAENIEFMGGEKKQADTAPAANYGEGNPFDDGEAPFDMSDEEFNALPV